MPSLKTTQTTTALGFCLLAALCGCSRQQQTPSPDAAASAAASSAEASASDAAASAAIARAKVPAAGTVANASGENQKVVPPSVGVAEQAQAAGDEAPQELRSRVDTAKAAGRAAKP